ncbi:hypothetical protein HYPSUDRAFT_209763 [Hypholoma sublateritium FD-334 SS-4]|uniref:Uncharacterized protein n=1 Tax=Hypholoma sublateritium (strain FD-334 SS-4) TaxID=945553 RepID=A0A0D2NXJ6_HYPSF|nr:hypothetical protein HYPSUDRAFT_209763 [Hypholoma sublateritium FD-334 SS-4]
MDDTEMDDARSEFASLFSARGSSADEDGDFSQPALDRPHSPNENREERRHGDGSMSVDSGEGSVVSLSVTEFVILARRLAQDEDAIYVFCTFVLNGVYEGQQYLVDPIKHAMGGSDRIKASRDYDSILGFGKHIYLDCDITLHPVCKLEDTLRRNIHIKRSFTNIYGDHDDVPAHHIPNLCIAKWGGAHNMLRAVIPGLYHKQRPSSSMDQLEFATFYEKGFRPAVESLSPAAAAEWPPTYQAELFRARGKHGTLALQTKTLGKWFVRELGDAIRAALHDNNVPWGEGLIFLYQIKGVKASNGHRTSAESAKLSLNELFSKNSITQDGIERGDWWIDVGLEISSGGEECLAWRTDHHFHIVKHILSIDTSNAQRITNPGSSKYIRDLTSHLTAVAGCRISPGVRAQGPHEAIYLQMYTTDKSVIYRPEGTHFGKHLTGKEILDNKVDAYCRGLYDLYTDADTAAIGLCV